MRVEDNMSVWSGPGYAKEYEQAVKNIQAYDRIMRHPTQGMEIHDTLYRDDNYVVYFIASDYDIEPDGAEGFVIIDLRTDRVWIAAFDGFGYVFDGSKAWFVPYGWSEEYDLKMADCFEDLPIEVGDIEDAIAHMNKIIDYLN
jgi:hypothetical protein